MYLISLRNLRALALAMVIMTGGQLYAEEAGVVKAEMEEFSAESSKLRTEHIQKMREIHVKHINELYDKKIAHNDEINSLMMKMVPGDKEANKSLREQIKSKREAFRESEKSFRKDFQQNVLKEQNKEFRGSMKERHQNMKEKKHKAPKN